MNMQDLSKWEKRVVQSVWPEIIRPKKKQGMLVYVKDAMERHHPGLQLKEWSVEMVRSLHDEIIEKAKSDVLL